MEEKENSPQRSEKRDLERLYPLPWVAQYLGFSRKTLYGWVKEGKVFKPERIVRVGRSIRIPRSEVERVAGSIRDNLKSS